MSRCNPINLRWWRGILVAFVVFEIPIVVEFAIFVLFCYCRVMGNQEKERGHQGAINM